MRSHYEIIRAAGADQIAQRLGLNVNTVRAWAQRNSVPAEQWKALVELDLTSLEELAELAPKPSREGRAA